MITLTVLSIISSSDNITNNNNIEFLCFALIMILVKNIYNREFQF